VGVINDIKNMMQVAKAVSASPEDPNLNNLLMDATRAVAEALKKLTEASKGVIPKRVEDFQEKAQSDIETLAEQELKGAASVIEKCVAKLNAASEAARQRAVEKGIDVDEQNITEAILEAAQAIAKSTAILVNAATNVQQEFQKMAREPKTGAVYKRDPQWAQGLISAARTVAGAVQHLVKAANSAVQGEASQEALIVAAQAVSAATAQLVTASTVKSDPNSQAQQRLREASSKVTQATSSLVDAAKSAAAWEEEKMEQQTDEKYALTQNKIVEMEKQMEILRLEKELEKARGALGTMRKKEYTDNTDPSAVPNVQSKANPNRPTTKQVAQQVAWKQTPTGVRLPNAQNANSNPAPPAPVPRKAQVSLQSPQLKS